MSSVKLKHSSGNGTIINGPVANPSADITLKVPSTTGSAGQVLSVATANHSATNAELEWAAGGGGGLRRQVGEVAEGEVDRLPKEPAGHPGGGGGRGGSAVMGSVGDGLCRSRALRRQRRRPSSGGGAAGARCCTMVQFGERPAVVGPTGRGAVGLRRSGHLGR